MAVEGHTIRVIITSFAKDFSKEREVLVKEVIPDLKAWCDSHQLHLQESEIQWGRADSFTLQPLLEEISQCYFNNIMPFFINITSDSLGLVPMWGEAAEWMIDDCQQRLGLSTGQMELLFAAYREDNQNGVFVIRNDDFLEDLDMEEEKKHFVSDGLIPKPVRAVTEKLLDRYPKERVLRYSYDCAGYDHCEETMRIEMGNAFSALVTQFVTRRLQQDYLPHELPGDVYAQMRDAQESFMKGRSHRLRGRDDVIQKMEEYINTGGQDVPLLLLGGAGSGKSSVMARVADLCVSKAAAGIIPNSGAGQQKVFYHFVGAAPRSTELEFFLKRLCKELDIIHESSMPKDLNATAQLCCNALSSTFTDPAVIFVDALNQFNEDQAAVLMSWLPRKLAPKVRCVVSLINDTPQHKSLMSRESKPQELHMTPLDFESRRQIVQETLGQYQRPLTADQLNRLLTKQTSENPLWLSMACEELRIIQDADSLDMRIDDLPDGLLNLLEQVLSRFELEQGPLVVATLCLLEASTTGLLEEELLSMLGDEQTLNPPSPFDEKEEKECSEKSDKSNTKTSLSGDKWAQVFRVLRPFLRPYGDCREGRLDFYHRAMSKAVRQKFFKQRDENADDEEALEMSVFWHRRLAEYFERCNNVDRKAEEYLYHLCKIGDIGRLIHCLTDWHMFDKLFNEEFSAQLLGYWRQVGGAGEMIAEYKVLLAQLEEQHPRDEEQLAARHQHIARIFLQAGKYSESLELTKVALKLEEQDLGNRTERMVELYSLMSEIYDEKLKLNDFVSRNQIPDLRKTIRYGRKSIALRKEMTGEYHKLKRGLSLMKLAFSLESWEACGGDRQLSGPDALREGNQHIDTALEIFKDLKDDGHYAEALMTKGVLAPRGSIEQLKYYNESMDICMQVYGEKSLLTSRLYINIGIVWEDNKNYVKAYDYFRKWCSVSEHVLGPTHPKTLRAKGVLKEPRYRLVALRISEQDFLQGENNAPNEGSINQEVEELDDITDEYNILNQSPPTWPEEAEEDFGGRGGAGGLGAELMDLAGVSGELREAINEIFLTAIGQDHMGDQILGSLAGSGLGGGDGPGEEGHREEENDDHDDNEEAGERPAGALDNREASAMDNESDNGEVNEHQQPDNHWPDNEVTMSPPPPPDTEDGDNTSNNPPPH